MNENLKGYLSSSETGQQCAGKEMENLSDITSYEELNKSTHYFIGIIYFATGFLGIGGHIWLILHMRKLDFLGDSTRRVLHVSLALSNCGIVGGFPLTGTSCFAERWLFGHIGCQFYGFYGMSVGLGSIYLLLALAVEHYMHVKHGIPSSRKESMHSRYILSAIVAFCCGVFWAALPLLGWASYALEPARHSCSLNWHSLKDVMSHTPNTSFTSYTPFTSYTSYLLSVTVACYAAPFSIIALCLIKCHSMQKEGMSRDSKEGELSSFQEEDAATTKLLACLAALALVTWSPYALLCFNSLFNDPRHVSTLLSSIPPLAAKIATCFVPLVYYAFVKRHKRQGKMLEATEKGGKLIVADTKETG